MKLKENYVLRKVADTWVVLPLGAASIAFNGMIKLNEAGALLWQALEQGANRESLAKVLCEHYAVESQQALTDVDEFLDRLKNASLLE